MKTAQIQVSSKTIEVKNVTKIEIQGGSLVVYTREGVAAACKEWDDVVLVDDPIAPGEVPFFENENLLVQTIEELEDKLVSARYKFHRVACAKYEAAFRSGEMPLSAAKDRYRNWMDGYDRYISDDSQEMRAREQEEMDKGFVV